jgi:hypothetical protein
VIDDTRASRCVAQTYLSLWRDITMGWLDWVTRAVGRDLDRRVSAADATAEGRFDSLLDEAPLEVRARLDEGQRGSLLLRVRSGDPAQPAGRQERGDGTLVCQLGPGRALRGGSLTIEAEVVGSSRPAELATLTVELSQPGSGDGAAAPHAFETYSVQGRAGPDGRARLRLTVSLG